MEDELNRAIVLNKSGKKIEAREILKQIVQNNPKNDRAWIWLADTYSDNSNRIKALEECLKNNPGNQYAQKGLATLKAEEAKKGGVEELSPSPIITQTKITITPKVKKTLGNVLFSSNGRISRSTFWYYNLSMFGLEIMAILADEFSSHYIPGFDNDPGIFFAIFGLFYIITGINVYIKRCHDLDESGWHILLLIIPIANLIVGANLAFTKGTKGPNKWGSDPINNSIPTQRTIERNVNSSDRIIIGNKKRDIVDIKKRVAFLLWRGTSKKSIVRQMIREGWEKEAALKLVNDMAGSSISRTT